MVDITSLMLTPIAAQDPAEESIKETFRTSLDQIKEDDRWMMDAWVGDANGILAFVGPNLLVPLFIISTRSSKTGLLAATIAAFIIEFYKTLSPNAGDRTVALLGQISQQLTNSRNGTSGTADQPFSPSVHMVWVNAMWLMSLVFSVTSALITTLNQQAVRRYIEMPKVPSRQIDRARVHLLLFRGVKIYKMPLAILAAPTLLHLSIWLFLGGLVIVFHTIYEKVAIAVDVAVGVSILVYTAMSLLPLLDFKCPYRTPITYVLWYLWHAFLSLAAYCGLLLLAKRLPGCPYLCPCPCPCLVPLDPDILDGPDNSDGAGPDKQYILPGFSNSLGKVVEKHGRYLTDGIWKSVINGATDLAEDEDRKSLTWLFRQLSLGDKNKLLVFAASIPRQKVIDLIPPIESGKIVLRKPLLILLRSCTEDTRVVGPEEDVRKRALLVCLTAVQGVARASSIPDLNFVRAEFANINVMRELWTDSDESICITSRSICALVARQVVRKRRLEEADLGWLQEITGEPPNAILNADVTERDQMNFKSFVYGALPNHVTHLSTEDATSFNETLAILLDVRTDSYMYFTSPDWQIRLSEEVGRIQQYDPEGGRGVFDRLHVMFPSLSTAPSVDINPSIYHEAPSLHRGAPSFHVEAPFYPREASTVHREAPSFHVEAPTTHREAPRPSFRRGAPSFHVEAPTIYREAPSFHVEAPFYPREAPTIHREAPSFHVEAPLPPRASPVVHYETPSPPVAPSPPAPRPRRATRSSQVTRPPL